MFTGRGVRSRRPQQGLIQRPRSNHDDGDVRSLGGSDRFSEPGLIAGPEFAALRKVDLDRRVGEVLLEAGERGDAVQRGVEEDIVAELDENVHSSGVDQ